MLRIFAALPMFTLYEQLFHELAMGTSGISLAKAGNLETLFQCLLVGQGRAGP